MRREWSLLLGVARVGIAGLVVACSSRTPSGAGLAPERDGGGDETMASPSSQPGSDAETATDAGDASAAGLRIAHLSPDLPPIDLCLAPHGTTSWNGPLIGHLATVDGGAPGLAYAQVSAYIPVGPGRYDVLIVPAGSTSCFRAADAPTADASGAYDATGSYDATDAERPPMLPVANLPPWPATGPATLVIAGEVSPAEGDEGVTFAIVADDGQLAGGAASLRAINAMPALPSMNLDLGAFGMKWTALLADVAFGAASTQSGPGNGAVDPNGYLPIPPLSGATLSAASAYATSDIVVARSVTVPVGSVATVFAIGGRALDPAHPPALLLCMDNEPSASLLSDCSVAQ